MRHHMQGRGWAKVKAVHPAQRGGVSDGSHHEAGGRMYWLIIAALVLFPAYSEAQVMQDRYVVYRMDSGCLTALARNQTGVYQYAKACGGVVEWKAERQRLATIDQIIEFREAFDQVHAVHFGSAAWWEKPVEWLWIRRR